MQKKLQNSFLDKQPLPICVKGFRKGESYRTYLYPHINSTYFFRTDIKDFFPSISEEQIKATMSSLLICDLDNDKAKIIDLLSEIVTLNGTLPQGACTSPSVSNLVMARLDQRILKYCQAFNVCYTRYADDLLFSSVDLNFEEKKWFFRKIKGILKSKGFEVNYSKNKYGNGQLSLDGYIISQTGIRLSRNRLSDIRHICSFVNNNIHILKCIGEDAFLLKVNELQLKHRDLHTYPFLSVFQLSQYLCGYRAFLISFLDQFDDDSTFQKELNHLICRIQQQIRQLP